MLNFVHNFRMDPASNYFRESVLNDVKKMSQEENIETSALKVEYITMFQKNGCETLPPHYLGLRNLFVDMSCSKGQAEKRKTRDIGQLFDASIKCFKAWCEDHEKCYGMDWLTDRDSRVPAADIIFTNLVREYNVAAWHNPKLDWTAKKIANEILSHMIEYYTINWQNGSKIEEDMLDDLMYMHEDIH